LGEEDELAARTLETLIVAVTGALFRLRIIELKLKGSVKL